MKLNHKISDFISCYGIRSVFNTVRKENMYCVVSIKKKKKMLKIFIVKITRVNTKFI